METYEGRVVDVVLSERIDMPGAVLSLDCPVRCPNEIWVSKFAYGEVNWPPRVGDTVIVCMPHLACDAIRR